LSKREISIISRYECNQLFVVEVEAVLVLELSVDWLLAAAATVLFV
jgi:hypothetical protein